MFWNTSWSTETRHSFRKVWWQWGSKKEVRCLNEACFLGLSTTPMKPTSISVSKMLMDKDFRVDAARCRNGQYRGKKLHSELGIFFRNRLQRKILTMLSGVWCSLDLRYGYKCILFARGWKKTWRRRILDFPIFTWATTYTNKLGHLKSARLIWFKTCKGMPSKTWFEFSFTWYIALLY